MYSKLSQLLPEQKIKINESMKNHTTFKIGGPADIMVFPANISDICTTIAYCHQEKITYVILGLGSNILVRDKGIRGVVIKLGNNLKSFSIAGQEIYAEAGIRLSELSRQASYANLSGLEFAEGIPGSLGGAIFMNAGAYNGEIKDVLYEVNAIDPTGHLRVFTRDNMDFSYRSSIFQTNEHMIVSARLILQYGNREQITNTMKNFASSRREKQPLDLPSAGSAFRRPNGFYVGPMLQEMGLKGYRVGGAQVSEKHAGFIVNVGEATADDVLTLIAFIQDKARERYGVDLRPEIRVIGEE